MGLFSRKTHETAEESYLRSAAARQADIGRKQAYAADQEAQKHQMTADVYGRPGTDYHDPATAAEAIRQRDAALNRRDQHQEAADRQKQIAAPPPAKRRWF
ncbi:hypothetical protein ACFY8X_39085 [Streptomyces tanashiensis]|uniref:hypothetical protein n=1 Tax=Streptomyces tanashiensis TaxID=67367 RepID=UPI0036EC4603